MTTYTPARGQKTVPESKPPVVRADVRPDEDGVPACAEDAAEAILRRPRVRTRYARTTTALVHSVRSGAAVTVVLTATVLALAVAAFR